MSEEEEIQFEPSYHLEWLVGDEVIFTPENLPPDLPEPLQEV